MSRIPTHTVEGTLDQPLRAAIMLATATAVGSDYTIPDLPRTAFTPYLLDYAQTEFGRPTSHQAA